MPVFTALGFTSATFSDFDFSILGIAFGNLAQVLPGWPLLVICVACYLAPIVFNLVAPKKVEEAK